MCTTSHPLPCSCGEPAIDGLEHCAPCLARVHVHRGDHDAAHALIDKGLITAERLAWVYREAGNYDAWTRRIHHAAVGRMGQ